MLYCKNMMIQLLWPLCSIYTFIIDKIFSIRAEFKLLESNIPSYSFTSMDSIMPECTTVLDHFDAITKPELVKIISSMHTTTCNVVRILFRLNY